MAGLIEDVAHLSQEIGARPSGTEEEQQAALYIAEDLQNEAGFQAIIEDFNGVSNPDSPKLICFGVAFVCALLALLIKVLAIPAFVVSLAAAILYALEVFDKPVLTRFLQSGVSQNVVAKYQPAGVPAKRRKIILVANYDSGKVSPEHKGFLLEKAWLINWVTFGALVALPVLLLLQAFVFAGASGPVDLVFKALTLIDTVLIAVPVVFAALQTKAAYTEAANNNAAGVAVMLDVARKVGQGRISLEEMEQLAAENEVSVEGEDAAWAAGVVAEGAELEYVAAPHEEPAPSPADSLAAAKAAIAAMTGQTVIDKVEIPSEELGLATEPTSEPEPVEEQPQAEETVVAEEETFRPAPEALQPGFTGMGSTVDKTPAWARTAQEKARANKPEPSQVNVSRSRYADTLGAKLTNSHTGAIPVAAVTAAAVTAETVVEEAVVETSAPAVEINNPWNEAARTESLSSDPSLAARLAALRNEIESAPTPHVSDEVKEIFARMDEEPAAKPVASRPASTQPVQTTVEKAPLAKAPVEEVFAESVSRETETAPQERGVAAGASPRRVRAAEATPANRFADFRNRFQEVAGNVTEVAAETFSRLRKEEPADETTAFAPYDEEMVEAIENGAVETFEEETIVEEAPRAGQSLRSARMQEPELEEELVEEGESLFEDFAADSDDDAEGPVEQTVEAMDVSFLMNKELEQVEAEPAAEPEVVDEPEEQPVKRVAPIASPRVTEAQFDGPISEEVTQPVSMDRIRAAMNAVAAAQPAPREVEHVAAALDSSVLPAISADEEPREVHHVISLPNLDPSEMANAEATQQRAPMAEAPSLQSNVLPRISFDEEPALVDRFGLDLPDFGEEPAVSHDTVSATSSFSTVGGTGAFAPVGDELVADVAPDEIYVDDADDSVFEEGHTQTGAFAGPEYVDLPTSRVGRFFGRFGKKKDKQAASEPSVTEWIDADEDYNARNVGAERGDWESFRQDERDWNGGALNLGKLRELGGSIKDRIPSRNQEPVEEIFYPEEEEAYTVIETPAPVAEPENARVAELNREMRKINDFRHPDIDTEVWFVALGSELSCNSGMRAFLDAHADELQGAIFVNLEALGAGKLTYLEEEGLFKSAKPSSRVKRFLRNATQRSGVSIATGKMKNRTTAAAIASKRGHQAFTVCGMKDGKTAYFAEAEDVIDNIDPQMLEDSSNFVMSLLKSI